LGPDWIQNEMSLISHHNHKSKCKMDWYISDAKVKIL